MSRVLDRHPGESPRRIGVLVDLSEHPISASALARRPVREPDAEGLPTMSEAELIRGYASVAREAAGAREIKQRAVAAAITEAEARLIARGEQ